MRQPLPQTQQKQNLKPRPMRHMQQNRLHQPKPQGANTMTIDQHRAKQLLNQIFEAWTELNSILSQAPEQPQTKPTENNNISTPKPATAELNFNPDICAWFPAQGPSGNFERAKDGTNFRFLKAYLEAHNGKATINALYYWLFPDKTAIGRKPSKTTNNNGGN